MRTCPAASRVQFNPPTALITPPPEAIQLTTRAQRQILHSPLTPNADAYCYDEEPWHSRPYTLFPALGHPHLRPRRHCPLLPTPPSHTRQHGNSQLREFVWHATCLQMDLNGSFACTEASGSCEWTQGFVCVCERAWDADEEPTEGVWLGGLLNTDAGRMDASANGLRGI